MSSGNLKRGRYVHAVRDHRKGTWLYRNLMNMCLIEANPSLDSSIYKFLNSPNSVPDSDQDAEIKELLLSKRFILEDYIDELSILESSFRRIKTDARIHSLAVVTTLQCNLRCEYCYQEHVDDTFSADDEAAVVALINSVASDVRLGTLPLEQFGITWWGGEPLLRIDLIERLSSLIVPIFAELGVKYSAFMSTNGVLLTKRNCRILRNAKVTRIQVTVDGPEIFHNEQRFNVAGRGTYRSVLSGLRNAAEGLNLGSRFITLRVNVTPRMIDRHGDWQSMLQDLSEFRDVVAVNISPAVANDFYQEDKAIANEDFLSEFSRIKSLFVEGGFTLHDQTHGSMPGVPYCGAIPDNNWIILPGGRLTKCTDKFHDRKSDCGKINRNGSIELFENAKKWLEYSPFKNETCRNCSVLPICMGGCQVVPFGSSSGDRCFRKTALEQSILEDPYRNVGGV